MDYCIESGDDSLHRLGLLPARHFPEARRALEVIRGIVEEELGLELHPEKTTITNFGRGFTFLLSVVNLWTGPVDLRL